MRVFLEKNVFRELGEALLFCFCMKTHVKTKQQHSWGYRMYLGLALAVGKQENPTWCRSFHPQHPCQPGSARRPRVSLSTRVSLAQLAAPASASTHVCSFSSSKLLCIHDSVSSWLLQHLPLSIRYFDVRRGNRCVIKCKTSQHLLLTCCALQWRRCAGCLPMVGSKWHMLYRRPHDLHACHQDTAASGRNQIIEMSTWRRLANVKACWTKHKHGINALKVKSGSDISSGSVEVVMAYVVCACLI